MFGAARYLPDGTLDPSFGNQGLVTVPIADSAVAGGVLIQPEGGSC